MPVYYKNEIIEIHNKICIVCGSNDIELCPKKYNDIELCSNGENWFDSIKCRNCANVVYSPILGYKYNNEQLVKVWNEVNNIEKKLLDINDSLEKLVKEKKKLERFQRKQDKINNS